MRQKSRRFLIALALLALGLILVLPTQPALAAPPRADKPGYTIVTLLTADPSKAEYMASFTPDVPSIFAWVFIIANQGAAEKQFQVDVQFISPDGQEVDSQWYKGDTGKVTSLSKDSYDRGSWAAKNISRRQLDIAGTDNASLIGQWTVNFRVGGKTMSVENFTLATASDVEISDAAAAAQKALEEQGYTVVTFGTTTWDDGTVIGYVEMPMVSTDLYSAETSKQIVDGYAALRPTYPKATTLLNELDYSERYTLVYYAKVTDWDAYVKSQNYIKLWNTLAYAVWDNQAQDWVQKAGAKDFVKKNFGAGTPKPPVSTSKKDTGTVGSIRVQVSSSTLPADGSSTADVTVTVFDKKNKALPNTDLTFATSGTGTGTVRPRATTTDSKGGATAIFTAGTKAGTVTITAAVGTTTGTAVVTLGEESSASDPADNVRTVLASQGLTVLDVQYDQSKSLAWVSIDLGAQITQDDLVVAIVFGCGTLRDNYPNAATVATIVPYQRRYLLTFPARAEDVDRLAAAWKAAKGDKAKQTAAVQAFIDTVVSNSVVMDANTGQVISPFKDFANKNFGG